MWKGFLKFITLYTALVLTSALIIVLALDADALAALGTASVGCLFKTVVATAHGWWWGAWQGKAINVTEYDVELVAYPCDCPQAEAA